MPWRSPGTPPTSLAPFRPGPPLTTGCDCQMQVGKRKAWGLCAGIRILGTRRWELQVPAASLPAAAPRRSLPAASQDAAAWLGAQSVSWKWCRHFCFPLAQGLGPQAWISPGSGYHVPRHIGACAGYWGPCPWGVHKAPNPASKTLPWRLTRHRAGMDVRAQCGAVRPAAKRSALAPRQGR